MKLKLSRKGLETGQKGIVYVLELTLDGQKVVKVGMTNRRVESRVCEILTSIWKRYRVFPECYVKRYQEFADPRTVEAAIHKKFKSMAASTRYTFTGCTEVFNASLEDVVEFYDTFKD